MANIKSAKKRVITSQVRADRNKAIKSRVKTYVKKVDAAVAAGDKAAAEAALPVAIAEISKAASKGIFHKNTAARKVSRITKAVNFSLIITGYYLRTGAYPRTCPFFYNKSCSYQYLTTA